MLEADEQDLHSVPLVKASLSLLRLRRDRTEQTPTYFATVAQRIAAMSHRFGGPGQAFADQVWIAHAAKDVRTAVWVVLDQDHQIVGHALAQLREWDGYLVGWVSQVEMDVIAGPKLLHQFLDELEQQWLPELNAYLAPANQKVTRMIMASPRMTNAWARHAGFHPHQQLFIRDVGRP